MVDPGIEIQQAIVVQNFSIASYVPYTTFITGQLEIHTCI